MSVSHRQHLVIMYLLRYYTYWARHRFAVESVLHDNDDAVQLPCKLSHSGIDNVIRTSISRCLASIVYYIDIFRVGTTISYRSIEQGLTDNRTARLVGVCVCPVSMLECSLVGRKVVDRLVKVEWTISFG